jgi:hypothetical protein
MLLMDLQLAPVAPLGNLLTILLGLAPLNLKIRTPIMSIGRGQVTVPDATSSLAGPPRAL